MELSIKQAMLMNDSLFRDRVSILAQNEADAVKVEAQGVNTVDVWTARIRHAKKFLNGKVDTRTMVKALLDTTSVKNSLDAVADPVTVAKLNDALTDTNLKNKIKARWTEWATD